MARRVALVALLGICWPFAGASLVASIERGIVLDGIRRNQTKYLLVHEIDVVGFLPMLRHARLIVSASDMVDAADAIGLAVEKERLHEGQSLRLHATGLMSPAFATHDWLLDSYPLEVVAGLPLSWPYARLAFVGTLAPIPFVVFLVRSGRRRQDAAEEPPERVWPPLVDTRVARSASRLERMAAARPRLYVSQVLAASLLGYVVILAMLLFGATWIAGCVYLIVLRLLPGYFAVIAITPGAAVVWTMLRAIRLRRPPIMGPRLTRGDAYLLWDMVDDICGELRAQRVDQIVLTGDLQASVLCQPRLGLAGWSRVTLFIGLPFLLLLPLDAIKAVLAHEIGHVSRKQQRVGAWVYRARDTWMQLWREVADRQPWGSSILLQFLSWYVPWFDTHSFVLARDFEFEADRASVSIIGATVTAQTLAYIAALDPYLATTFWRPYIAQADTLRDIPEPPYARMARFPEQSVDRDALQQALDAALKREAEPHSTHPSLRQRLARIGEPPVLPTYIAPPAARAIFAASYDASIARIDEGWLTENREAWRHRFEEREKERGELASLAEAAATEPLDQPRALRRAWLTETLRGFDEAVALYEEILAADADHAPSLFALGSAALARGEDAGLAMLDRCMELDDDAIVPGCEAVVRYLMARDRVAEAEPYVRRYDRRRHLLGLAASERNQIDPNDRFLPHGLGPDAVEAIQTILRQHPTIARAYLWRRNLRHLTEPPSYILAITLRSSAVTAAGASVLLQEIADGLPLAHATVLRLTRYERFWRWRRLTRRSALIYRA